MHLDVNVQNNGYIYIFVANESMANIAVYFDDMRVQHTESPATSASDYYPFGLTMINRSYTSEPYRFGYQGQFAEYDEETGWNSFELRQYDPVIGRWTTIDPKRQYWSPYLAMGNNPIRRIDPDGGGDGDGDPEVVSIDGVESVLMDEIMILDIGGVKPKQPEIVASDATSRIEINRLMMHMSEKEKYEAIFGIAFAGENGGNSIIRTKAKYVSIIDGEALLMLLDRGGGPSLGGSLPVGNGLNKVLGVLGLGSYGSQGSGFNGKEAVIGNVFESYLNVYEDTLIIHLDKHGNNSGNIPKATAEERDSIKTNNIPLRRTNYWEN